MNTSKLIIDCMIRINARRRDWRTFTFLCVCFLLLSFSCPHLRSEHHKPTKLRAGKRVKERKKGNQTTHRQIVSNLVKEKKKHLLHNTVRPLSLFSSALCCEFVFLVFFLRKLRARTSLSVWFSNFIFTRSSPVLGRQFNRNQSFIVHSTDRYRRTERRWEKPLSIVHMILTLLPNFRSHQRRIDFQSPLSVRWVCLPQFAYIKLIFMKSTEMVEASCCSGAIETDLLQH